MTCNNPLNSSHHLIRDKINHILNTDVEVKYQKSKIKWDLLIIIIIKIIIKIIIDLFIESSTVLP